MVKYEREPKEIRIAVPNGNYEVTLEITAQLEELFPALLPELAFKTYIRKNIDVKKAPIALLPLCQYAPKCTASADYAALCDEMLERMEG